MEAEATFPRGDAPAKAKLVDLIMHSLKACSDRIDAIVAHARTDKAARGGGAFVIHYVLTVPAGWDELAKSVMRRAAVLAGEEGGVIPSPRAAAYLPAPSRRPPCRAHVLCTRARVRRPLGALLALRRQPPALWRQPRHL